MYVCLPEGPSGYSQVSPLSDFHTSAGAPTRSRTCCAGMPGFSDSKLAQPAASSAATRIVDHGLARLSTSDPGLRQQFWSIHRISSCFSVDLTVPEVRSNITLKNIGFTCW